MTMRTIALLFILFTLLQVKNGFDQPLHGGGDGEDHPSDVPCAREEADNEIDRKANCPDQAVDALGKRRLGSTRLHFRFPS